MIAIFFASAAIALSTAATLGWVLAARRGRAIRDALLAQLGELRSAGADADVAEMPAQLAAARHDLISAELAAEAACSEADEIAKQLASTQDLLAVRTDELMATRAQLAARTDELSSTRAQLTARSGELASARARVEKDDDTRALDEVRRVLAPLLERERLSTELARIDVGRGSRGELPQLMDALARAGGFSSVVLSDEIGLPLAVNSGAEDGDQIAGMWSMLLTVADRVALSGAPAAQSVVVHDAANQTLLHRLFTSSGNRFLLTAVSRGRALSPDVLDPALGKLERILAAS